MDNRLKEYESLRNEISQKIKLHNTSLTFTITATVTSLSFALSHDNNLLYFIPFCILIPMSIRLMYYRSSMSKLSAYLIVFLESDIDGLKWETRNAEVINGLIHKEKRDPNIFVFSRNYECLVLSIVCYAFYVNELLKDHEGYFITTITMLLTSSLVIWEAMITKHMNNVHKEKQRWMDYWSKVKDNSGLGA